MKNVHILPTNKPSRLFYNVGGALLFTNYKNQNGVNIYITSDEDIKEGDWCIDEKENIVKADKDFIFNCSHEFNEFWKKIILTTDADLIKDGVQPIDDEFLEWFVNNSNCEEVEVNYQTIGLKNGVWQYHYKINIPKEEPKQETLINDTDSHSLGFENFEVIKTEEDAKIFVEALEKITEPNEKLKKAFREYEKQETLEEVHSKFELIGPDMDEILDAINFINENYKEVKLKPMDWSLLVSDNYSIFVKFEPEGDENKHIRYMNDLLSENDFECKL